jgi:hypothetical protein
MIPPAKVPGYIAEAIERVWPDGVVEIIDVEEAPFWDTYPALKARLSRIHGSELVYERKAAGGPRWDEGSDPHEEPPAWSEPTRSYHLFFLSPSDPRYSFDTETIEPDEAGVEQRFDGQGRIGHTIAVSLVAPFALVALDEFETFENGSRSEPGVAGHLFDLEGKRLDLESHYLELFGEEAMRVLAKQRDKIARILKAHAISILPAEHLDAPVPRLRAGEDVLQGFTKEPLTVRDAFFFETV